MPYGFWNTLLENRKVELASQPTMEEKLTAQEGDNILSVYTSSLDKSSYTLELVDSNNNVLGRAVFVNQ